MPSAPLGRTNQACEPSGEKNIDTACAAFWSGTTAQIDGSAGAATCLVLREGRFGWTAIVGLLGEGAAATTGALRVAAGAHSWTDVGAAFVAGNALGFAMCYCTRQRLPSRRAHGARPEVSWHVAPSGVSLQATF